MGRHVAVCLAAALGTACGRIGYDAVADAGDGVGSLRLTPGTATINLSTSVQFTAEDGVPPYAYRVAAGAGTIDATGRFTAPARAGTTTVTVTDDTGDVASADVRHEGSRLFAIAGAIGGVPIDSVLASDDGGATWQQVGRLPAPRESGSAVVYEGRIYYLGGVDTGLASMTEVWASSDGVSWTLAGNLPGPATSGAATVHRGQLWFLGGWHGGNLDGAFSSSDGAAWAPATPLPSGRHEMEAISRGDRLYLVGGHDASTFPTELIYTTNGASWTTGPGRTNIAIDFAAAGELGDLVFHGAGTGSVAMETSSDLETWTAAAPIPGSPREGPALVGHQGRMLLIGGAAPVLTTTDGSSWTAIGMLPDARSRTAVVQFTPR